MGELVSLNPEDEEVESVSSVSSGHAVGVATDHVYTQDEIEVTMNQVQVLAAVVRHLLVEKAVNEDLFETYDSCSEAFIILTAEDLNEVTTYGLDLTTNPTSKTIEFKLTHPNGPEAPLAAAG